MENTSYPKLDPEFKAKWIAALRSGEYKQTDLGTLRFGDSYCCLGVAGVVLGMDLPPEDCDQKYKVIYDEMDRIFGNPHTKKVLWNMNDSEGKSFHEIADWIEANL